MSETLEFQTMNHFRSNNNSLKYQRFTPSGCKDIAIVKSESVAKTQFLCLHRIFFSLLFILFNLKCIHRQKNYKKREKKRNIYD